MVKTLLRSTLREIRQSLGRYLAIMAIVGLGVGFFAGLRMCQPAMMATGVEYLDTYRLYDFRLLSTLGFTEDDVAEVSAMDGVAIARGAVYTDFLTVRDGEELVLRAHSLTEGLNEPELVSGRMPEAADECLADARSFSEADLGTVLPVAEDNDEDTKELMYYDGYTIVGTAYSPYYLNYERGTGSIGSGSINAFVYIPEEGFDFDAYYEIFVALKDRGEAYSDAYQQQIDALTEAVEDMTGTLAIRRHDNIYNDAMDEIRDGERELSDGWDEYRTGRADAERELNDAYQDLVDGEKEYENGVADYEQGKLDYADGLREYQDGLRELEDAEEQLRDAEQQLNDGETELAGAQSDLQDARQELDDGWKEYEQAKADTERELEDAYLKLQDGEAEYDDGLREYEEGLREYQDGLRAYEEGERQVRENEQKLAEAEQQVEDGRRELANGENELLYSQYQLQNGKAELDANKAKLDEAAAQIQQLQAAYDQANSVCQQVSQTAQQFGMSAEQLMSDPDLLLQAAGGDADAAASLQAGWAQAVAAVAQTGPLLESSRAAYESGLAAYDAGLAQYQDGVRQYEEGAAQLEAARQELAEGERALEEGRAQLNEAQQQLAESQRQLEDARLELENGRQELEDARKELDDGWKEYEDGKAQAERELNDAYQELTDGESEYSDGVKKYEDGRAELDQARRDYDDGRAQADSARRELNDGKAELDDAQQQLTDAEQQIPESRQELDDGWQDYYDGKAEAEQKFADTEDELADAQQEIADAYDELSELEEPVTYVLTRDENIGYASFDNDTSIVAAISVVFPVFFFLVAALVCMTTMTRMVDEQRTQIGVLKALGYSNGQIMGKYLFYSGSAALVGCVAGYAIGSTALPWVIWEIYGMIYGFAPLRMVFRPSLALVSFAAAMLCSMGATYLSCRVELNRQAAELIRPKTPKAGRRVLLEHIDPLWRRLSFLYKVSVRNVLRYHSRLIMMVLGIGGCTALLATGFGIRDSIAHVADDQFDEITLYDYSVTFQDAQTPESAAAYLEEYGWSPETGLLVHSGSTDVVAQDGTKSVYLVISSTDSLDGFLSLHSGEEPIAYPGKDEVVLNVGLAKRLGISQGDTVLLRDEELGSMTVTVSAICDNYVFNYVYVSAETYAEQLGQPPEYNTLYVLAHEGADPYAEGALLLEDGDVGSVTVNAETRSRVDNMLSRLDYIVVVVVLCAAALAFIVLYNLTNINITERIREIATIKVLGFYQNEVAAYVFREIAILAVLGSLVGLLMGKALHAYVMAQIKIDAMFFACRITPVSYLLSLGLTMVFTAVIAVGMRPRLRRIDMAESLKSIE